MCPPYPRYEIYFLTVKLVDLETYATLGNFILDYTFFLMFNLVGAILGYWISKTAFIDKLLKKRQNISP